MIAICIDSLAIIVFVILLPVAIALKLRVLIDFPCHTVRGLDIEWHSGPGRRVRAWSFHWDKFMLSPSIFKSKFFLLVLDIYWFISMVFVMSDFSILLRFLDLLIILVGSCTRCLTGFALMNDCWVFTVHYICLECLGLNSWFILRYFSYLGNYLFLRFWSFQFNAFFIWWNTHFTLSFLGAWMKWLLGIFCCYILLFRIVNWHFYRLLRFQTVNLRFLQCLRIFFALPLSCGEI